MGSDARRSRSKQSEKDKENMHSVTGQSNSEETRIGGASVENAEKVEKAGQKVE